MGRNVVKVDLGVTRQAAVARRFVGVEVVQDDMHSPLRVSRHQAIHEVPKLHPAAGRIVTRSHRSGGHLQGSNRVVVSCHQ
jgi:hypothetical protein